MLSVKAFIEYTRSHAPNVFRNAKSVAVRFTSVREDKDSDGDKFKLVKATCVGETNPRYVVLQFYGKGPSAKLWATCTCEYFLYHAEVANKRKGSADIIHSNGATPRITNPQMIPHLCKHLIAALQRGALEIKPTTKRKPGSVELKS